MPPHRGPVDIDKLILPRQILHARDLIGEGIVSSHPPVVVWPVQQPSSAIGSAAIALVGRRQEEGCWRTVVEGLGPTRRASSVDGHNDEAQLRERLAVAVRRGPRARAHAAGLRAGVADGATVKLPSADSRGREGQKGLTRCSRSGTSYPRPSQWE